VSQVLETSANGTNVVVVSTMSCIYYKVNLKNGNVEAKLQGFSKFSVDLIRAPIFDKANANQPTTEIIDEDNPNSFPKYCGIEANCIVLVDFERNETKKLQGFQKNEFKSPWYQATFFLKDKYDFMVVGEEQSGQTRCFQI
jgi:hypothetical protein